MPVRNNLKSIRLRMEFEDQQDFAKYISIGQSNYNQIENNKKQVTLETALKIAKKLNIPVEQIFELE